MWTRWISVCGFMPPYILHIFPIIGNSMTSWTIFDYPKWNMIPLWNTYFFGKAIIPICQVFNSRGALGGQNKFEKKKFSSKFMSKMECKF